jgi:hypothetical protein
MGFIKTTSKVIAIKAFLNEWLKDPTFYCGNCLTKFNPNFHVIESCCETPAFGRNIDHTRLVIKDNLRMKKDLLNETGATSKGVMRLGVNIPPQLYYDLERYFKAHGEKFLADNKELREFMKAFPMFCIPNKI